MTPGAISPLTTWSADPGVLLGLMTLQGLYLAGIGPLRQRFQLGEPVSRPQILCFQAALLSIVLATMSPIHELADNWLFSAHMVQHMLLMQVMPPLLLLGIPGWLWQPLLRLPGMLPLGRLLTAGVVAFFLADAIFGLWHIPAFYDAAMRNHNLHIAMHLTFMISAVIMWWPIFSQVPELPPLPQPFQMLYLFLQSIPASIIGALIALSDEPSYPWYVEVPRVFSLSAMDDQKLGGLIMWVPGSMVFWLFLTIVFFQWWNRSEQEDWEELEEAAAT